MVNVGRTGTVGQISRAQRKPQIAVRTFSGTVMEVLSKKGAQLGIVVEPVTPSRTHGCLRVFVPKANIPQVRLSNILQVGAVINVETTGEYAETFDGRRLEVAKVL
ncbi:MAG: hypothetical protein WCV91_00605 [Candidatus Margulisiibacteriota bacterium]